MTDSPYKKKNTYKQRIIKTNSSKTLVKYYSQIYSQIEKQIGLTKICNFGHTHGSKLNIKHEGECRIPIREFALRNVEIKNEQIVIGSGDGLQNYCKTCSKKYRKLRSEREREYKQNKSPEEIYKLYEHKYNTNLKRCSKCHNEQQLNEFRLSIGMECGLHNICRTCSTAYGSSIGDRWIIYMPDGNYKYNKKINTNNANMNLNINAIDNLDNMDTNSIQYKDIHDDHIFPLSLGGSNESINHQLINSYDNLKKSNRISPFKSVHHIEPTMLSERFRDVLEDITDLGELRITLQERVHDDIVSRNKLNDTELFKLYEDYCIKYNLNKDINRAVTKFRTYCKMNQ